MITEASLSLLQTGLILSILFTILCFKMLWYMMGNFIKAPVRERNFTRCGITLDAVIFLLILIPFLYLEKDLPVPAIWSIPSRIPHPIWYLYCLLSGLYTFYVRHNLVKWRETHVTVKTIHQALDNLSMGICVFNSKGILQMANYQMQNLCRRHTGKPLLNGLYWDQVVSALPDQMLIFPDNEIWHFRKFRKEKDTTVITAVNVSEEMRLNRELHKENLQLAGINQRMRQYGLDLEDIIKQEELLRTQIRVHDELGHILLTSRVFMNKADFAVSESELRREWKTLLLSMKDFQDTAEDDSQISDLTKAAKALGITMILQGNLPSSQTLRHLLASAARECLTNAAKAEAKTLWITIRPSDDKHNTTSISFTNDGLAPEGPVHEGVGLGTLRQIVEREGASMNIETENGFCLTITM